VKNQNKNNLPLTDFLALERTLLANERTFLAYFRTSVIFLATGLGFLNIQMLENVELLGIAFIILSPVVLSIGIYRLFRVKKKIRQFYQ
jgi:putative membrane protein